MSHYADEPYAAYVHTRRKARKAHRCCACSETIKPGHFYMYVSTVYDGHADDFKRCLRCDTIFNAIVAKQRSAGHDDQWPDEDLNCGHDWRENFEEDPPEDVARLAFMSQAEAQEQLTKPATEAK